MGVIKFKKRDKNRFRKVYPYLRRKPVNETILEGSADIQVGFIEYVNTDTGVYTFTTSFTTVPIITAIAVETLAGTDANINVYIEAVTLSNVTIRVSDENFTGHVHLHAITAS